MIRKCLLLLISTLFIYSCGSSEDKVVKSAFREYHGNYIILISKKKFSLCVYERDKGVIASYKIGIGRNSDLAAKLYDGDNRTPEGRYYINEMLSMDSDKNTESYRKLKKMNEYYFKKRNGYTKFGNSGADLGDNAYGPRYFGINYPDENDMKRYGESLSVGKIPFTNHDGRRAEIGNGIAIHGNNDEASIGHPCSSGCIRMYNRDIVELEKYVLLSTPVIILHD